MSKKASKKARSYTVAFGELEISVSTASVDTSEDPIIPPKPSGKKDEAIIRAVEHNRRREASKRIIKDDRYWDAQHAGAESVAEEIPKKETTTNAVRPAVVASRSQPADIQKETSDSSIDVPWLETIPDSVRSIVENAENHIQQQMSVGTWSDQKHSNKKTDVADYFGGLQNIEAVVCCWNCSEPLQMSHHRQFPKFMPYKYQSSSKYFMVRGYYCTWECVKLHAIQLSSHNLFNLLALLLASLHNKVIHIRPLCNKYQMKQYGGLHTRQEFMKCVHECNKQRITHKLEWHPSIPNCVRVFKLKKGN